MWWIGNLFAPKKMQPSELFLRKKPLGCIEDALIRAINKSICKEQLYALNLILTCSNFELVT
jgi:hypothetical protein